jgi:Methyltransferase domain
MNHLMKDLLKKILSVAGAPLDAIFAVFAVPCALVLLAYRKTGSARLPITTATLQKIGVFPIRNHYYEPLFDTSVLETPLSEDRSLPGIDLDPEGQLGFLEQLKYSSELISMDLLKPSIDPSHFSLPNPSFASGDAEYLYQILRTIKPHNVIEIGSGNSTKIAAAAIRKNAEEPGIPAVHTCIEPYEMPWLETLHGVQIVRKRLEHSDLDWRTALKSGDLLFIDSSHIIRPQGDVLKEYLEILPQLASGVFVHVHDIFTPKDYLQEWVTQDIRFWNEQYLLEALLANTSRYKVVGALNFLKHHHYDRLKEVCPYLTLDREPGSLYFRVQ